MGGHGLGVAYGHIKAFGLFPFPHQRKVCVEGLQGRHALSMLEFINSIILKVPYTLAKLAICYCIFHFGYWIE